MIKLKCEVCDGSLVVQEDGMFLCEFCGTKYMKERAKQMFAEQSGQVRVANMATVDSLLARAEEFRAKGEMDTAREYFNRVLDIDPTNAPARDGVDNLEIHELVLEETGKQPKLIAFSIKEATGWGNMQVVGFITNVPSVLKAEESKVNLETLRKKLVEQGAKIAVK